MRILFFVFWLWSAELMWTTRGRDVLLGMDPHIPLFWLLTMPPLIPSVAEFAELVVGYIDAIHRGKL